MPEPPVLADVPPVEAGAPPLEDAPPEPTVPPDDVRPPVAVAPPDDDVAPPVDEVVPPVEDTAPPLPVTPPVDEVAPPEPLPVPGEDSEEQAITVENSKTARENDAAREVLIVGTPERTGGRTVASPWPVCQQDRDLRRMGVCPVKAGKETVDVVPRRPACVLS